MAKVADQPITVTDIAIKKILEFAKEEKKDGWGLKILAQDNDGFEPAYEMNFLKEPDNNDTVLEFGDKKASVKIFLDGESMGNLEGAEVDFLETEYGSGFKITNPQFPEELGGCGPGGCEGCSGGCG